MSLEFALVGGTFALLVLYAVQASMVLWIKNAYEVAASQTARCAANASTACSSGAQTYALARLDEWGVNTLLSPPSITVAPGVTCSPTAGTYTSVTITSTTGLAWLMPPLNAVSLTSTACYPTSS